MKQKTICAGLTIFIVSILLAVPKPSLTQTAEEITRIESAVPAKATVAPEKKRNLLVFSLSLGFRHSAIPYADKAVEIMAQKTGAFNVTISTDSTIFSAKKLRKFDAILFNNTSELIFSDPNSRKALMAFIKGGKGIAGWHAATDNFYVWPEAAEMMGGTFWGHPWISKGTWAIKIDDPDHKLAAAFEGQNFKINDEIYRTKPPYFGHTREKLRILVSLDMTDDVTRMAKGVRPDDKDLPVAWIRDYGKGRVFYGGFGHNHDVFWNPAILRFYLDGLQYVLGDLASDATPSMDKAFAELRKYDYGKSRVWLTELEEFVRSVLDSADATAKYEARFIDVVKSNVSYAAKDFACRQLSIIGTGASAATLGEMLKDAKTADIARYALERIPYSAAEQALLQALPKASGNTKIGIISSLGQKRSGSAVPELRNLVKDSDVLIANAAIAALANIADAQAMSALADARSGSTGQLRNRITDAYLACADQFARQGDGSKAEAVYHEVYNSDEATRLRYAALRGLVNVEADGIEATVVNAIKSENLEMQKVAIGLIREVPGSTIISQAADLLEQLPQAAQIQMMAALADRGDKAALPQVSKAVQSDNEYVRMAALTALGSLGDVKTVDVLVTTALDKRGDELDVIRKSLDRMPGKDIDQAILDAITQSEGRKKAEYVRTAGARNIPGSTGLLIGTAQDSDKFVRMESIKALKTVAKPDDLPELIRLLVEGQSDAERKEALQSASAVAHKITDKNKQAEAALAAIPTAKDVAAKSVLLQLLGRIGDTSALPVLRQSLADDNIEIRTAAVRGLTEWPDSQPADDLLAVARNAGDEVERILALRGYIRLTGLPSERTADETVKMYRTAMALSPSVNEKRLVLSGLANLSSLPSLTMAGEYLGDSELKAEAEQAILKIADDGRLRRAHPQELQKYLSQVQSGTSHERVKQEAQELLDRISDQ